MDSKGRKIQDFLHLYIGCHKIVYDPNRKIDNKPSPLFPFYWSNHEYVIEGIFKDKFKLCLRPLSDMTEEEKKEYKELFLESPNCYEKTRWLLSKHFDLFDLIPDQLALDKTKI